MYCCKRKIFYLENSGSCVASIHILFTLLFTSAQVAPLPSFFSAHVGLVHIHAYSGNKKVIVCEIAHRSS